MKKHRWFDILILIGRPASGKSEIIHYLKSIAKTDRINKFYIGEFEEIDDFPILWSWLEEDMILQEMGKQRLHTTADGYFKEQFFWDLLIRKISLKYEKLLKKDPHYHSRYTSIIEFSRGTEHGGYRRAFDHLSPQILSASAILYINVSYKESLRKNRIRYNPREPDSILQHSLPENKMEKLYKACDWANFSSANPHYLELKGIHIPYTVFDNEDDVTTTPSEALGRRLEKTLERLWELYIKRKS
jgi:hypothetical protein